MKPIDLFLNLTVNNCTFSTEDSEGSAIVDFFEGTSMKKFESEMCDMRVFVFRIHFVKR